MTAFLSKALVRCRATSLVFVLFPAVAQSLKRVGTIELPGPKGQRFDYLTVDDEDRYLLSAHLGPGILYVIDLKGNKLIKAIPGVPGITGVEYIPGLHKAYTSDWGEEKIGVVDLIKMTVVKNCRPGRSQTAVCMRSRFERSTW